MTIELEDNFVKNLKREFNNLEVKEIIHKLYQSHKDRDTLNIEEIKDDDLDYKYILEARERREKGEKTHSIDEVLKEFEW